MQRKIALKLIQLCEFSLHRGSINRQIGFNHDDKLEITNVN